MGRWTQGLFGIYSPYSPILTNPEPKYHQVWVFLLQIVVTLLGRILILWYHGTCTIRATRLYCPYYYKLSRRWIGWWFYVSQHPALSVPPAMGPQVPGLGLFVIYSSYKPVTSNLKHVYGCFWSDPIPPNCHVFRADGHFKVARTMYYLYYQSKCYSTHITPSCPFWTTYIARLGVTLFPQTVTLLGRTVF